MDFNYVDLFILIPVLYGLYKGYTKGLILSVTTLLGLVLGIWAGVKFSHLTANFLLEEFQIDIPLLAFAVTFLGIMIGMYFLGKTLNKIARAIALGLFDNIGGAIFGAGKIILILAVMLLFFENINENFQLVDTNLLNDSILYTYLKQTSEVVFPFLNDLKQHAPENLPQEF